MPLRNVHLSILKAFIDELIAKNGVLDIPNPDKIVEKVKIDYLAKLACRFYSKINNSEKYASYLKKYEHSHNIEEDREFQPVLKYILNDIFFKHKEQTIQCLNCGRDITFAELKRAGTDIPLCDECYHNIGTELDIWQRVFRKH